MINVRERTLPFALADMVRDRPPGCDHADQRRRAQHQGAARRLQLVLFLLPVRQGRLRDGHREHQGQLPPQAPQDPPDLLHGDGLQIHQGYRRVPADQSVHRRLAAEGRGDF